MDIIILGNNGWACSNIVERGNRLDPIGDFKYRKIDNFQAKHIFIANGSFNGWEDVSVLIKDKGVVKGYLGRCNIVKGTATVEYDKELSKEEVNKVITKIKLQWQE